MVGIGPPAMAAFTCLITAASDTAGVPAAGTAHMNGVHTRCKVVLRHVPAALPRTGTTFAHETATTAGLPLNTTRPCAATDTTVTPTTGVPERNVRDDVQIFARALVHAVTEVSLTSSHDWAQSILPIAFGDAEAVACAVGFAEAFVVGFVVGITVAAAVGSAVIVAATVAAGMVDGIGAVVADGMAVGVAVGLAEGVAGSRTTSGNALAVAVAPAGFAAAVGHLIDPFTHGHVTPSRSAGTHAVGRGSAVGTGVSTGLVDASTVRGRVTGVVVGAVVIITSSEVG